MPRLNETIIFNGLPLLAFTLIAPSFPTWSGEDSMEWMFVDFPLKSRSRLVWIGGEWGEEARWLAIARAHFPFPVCVHWRCVREGNGNYRLFLWRSYATDTHPHSHYPADQPSSLCLRSESIRFQIWPKMLQKMRERDVTSQPPAHTLYELLVHLVSVPFHFFKRWIMNLITKGNVAAFAGLTEVLN